MQVLQKYVQRQECIVLSYNDELLPLVLGKELLKMYPRPSQNLKLKSLLG
jgi:hypothetical protein